MPRRSRKLPRGQQSLVHNHARRKRAEIGAFGQSRLGPLAEERKIALELVRKTGGAIARARRLDEELPDFGHGFKSALAQSIRVHRNAAPTHQAELASADRILDGGARVGQPGRGSKEHADTKGLVEDNFFLGSAGTEELNREAGQKAGAIAAGTIGINAAAVRKTLEGLQRKLEDFVTRRTAQLSEKAGTARVMVRVSPVGMAWFRRSIGTATHNSLIVAARQNVQCRIFL